MFETKRTFRVKTSTKTTTTKLSHEKMFLNKNLQF